MIWLLLLILAILVFGVFGAIKLAFWVLLLAVLVAVVAGLLGRGLFTDHGSSVRPRLRAAPNAASTTTATSTTADGTRPATGGADWGSACATKALP